MNSYSIIIPAYNEEKAITQVVTDIKEHLPLCELIVVNDCSTDKTAELAEAAGAKVINHRINYGYGSSIKTGIKVASGEYVLMCDADGQHRVEDVKLLIDECEDFDVVIGTRGKDSYVQKRRRTGKFILKHFANYLAGEKILDLNSGLRIFRKEVIIKYMHLTSDRFSFSTTSTFAMLKTHQRLKYVPIKVQKRIGKSSVKQIRDGTYALMVILRMTVLFNPLKVFFHTVLFCLFLASVSLILDIISAGKFNIGDTTALFFVSALIIFMFGLVCDQIAAIRREIHE